VELRRRAPGALDRARHELAAVIRWQAFVQFLFFRQWANLKAYANARGVLLFGDLPIFPAHDSAEVWASQGCFLLDQDGQAECVAGVPPDYFSAQGQRWGNPLYRWEYVEAQDYEFWIERLRTQLELYDLLRLDHFRGFEAAWHIPAEADTGEQGVWLPGPGARLFTRLEDEFGLLPLVAEDLGYITEPVKRLRKQFAFPGMKILQFAFSGDAQNNYLPHHYSRNCVAYTGTHDNDTTLGWFHKLSWPERHVVLEYLGRPEEAMPWPMIRAAFASRANLAIVPLQDFLELDGHHRMNAPGTTAGNWSWRFAWSQMPADLAGRIHRLAALYSRRNAPDA
jgi:4-alpha-glucanotransferase